MWILLLFQSQTTLIEMDGTILAMPAQKRCVLTIPAVHIAVVCWLGVCLLDDI